MGLDRFYCPAIMRDGPSVLDGDEARHLARVRRVPVGAEVELFDGRGQAVRAEVVALGRDQATLRVVEWLAARPGPPMAVTLATAIPKGERFDWLIEKATELGVARVVPILAERSTVDPRAAKLDRLRRVVIEASKQSRRDTLMALDAPQPWDRWAVRSASETEFAHRWLAHPGAPTAWRNHPLSAGESVALAIGPEGGFTEREIDLARAAGWEVAGLTDLILRIETAALVAAAQCLARAGST